MGHDWSEATIFTMTGSDWIWILIVNLLAGDLYAFWTVRSLRKRIDALEARQRQVFLKIALPFNDSSLSRDSPLSQPPPPSSLS